MIKQWKTSSLFALLIISFFGSMVWATTYYVRDVKGEGFNYSDTAATKSLIQSAVAHTKDNRIVQNPLAAEYVLQPELVRLGNNYVLKIDKLQNNMVVFSSRADLKQIEDLSNVAPKVTHAVLEERALEEPQQEIAEEESPAPAAEVSRAPQGQVSLENPTHYWVASIGPSFSGNMDAHNPMYDVAIAHVWEIHPQIAAKAVGSAAFGSANEDTQFLNAGAGAVYFLNAERTAPYVEGTMGYGNVKSNIGERASGFSLAAAVGYQFLRVGNRSADAQIHYALLTQPLPSGGNPSVLGARFGMSF